MIRSVTGGYDISRRPGAGNNMPEQLAGTTEAPWFAA